MWLALLVACGSSSTPSAEVPAPDPVASATPAAAAPVAAAPAGAEGDCPAATYGTMPVDLGEPVAADALRTGAVASGSRVKLKGTIKEVCQKKGCWHTVATSDPAVDLMVKDKEYAIFLPKGCGGHEAEIAGTFTQELMPVEEARHYAEDAGKDPSTITEAPTRLLVDVEAVAIK